MWLELSLPNSLIPLFNNSDSFALLLLYYTFIILSNTPIKLYNPFPMAYGVCSEEKHVYELKDGKNTKSSYGTPSGTVLPRWLEQGSMSDPRSRIGESAMRRRLAMYYADLDALSIPFTSVLTEVNSS